MTHEEAHIIIHKDVNLMTPSEFIHLLNHLRECPPCWQYCQEEDKRHPSSDIAAKNKREEFISKAKQDPELCLLIK
jgi:hypothetical protein